MMFAFAFVDKACRWRGMLRRGITVDRSVDVLAMRLPITDLPEGGRVPVHCRQRAS
jgi:hypothetical protein